MPELSAFLTSAKTLISAASVLAGGVFVKLYNTYLKRDQQEHNQSLDLMDSYATRLEVVETRLDESEQERINIRQQLNKTQQHLAASKAREEELKTKLDLVIMMLNDMRGREGLDEISEDDIIPTALSNA